MRVLRKCRIPLGSDRLLLQNHSGLFRSPVSLRMIAFDARQYAILPRRLSSVRSRNNVVDGQLLRCRLLIAVLAGEPVTLEDVSSAECHCVRWQSIVGRQHNDFWNPDSVAPSPDDQFVVGRDQLSPVGSRVLAIVVGVDDPRRLVPDLHQ